MTIRITQRPKKRTPDELVDPVVALDGDNELVVVRMREVADSVNLSFSKFLPQVPDEVAADAFATASIISLLMRGAVPFVDRGRQYGDEQRVGEFIDFQPQTEWMRARFNLYGLPSSTANGLVDDPTRPMFSAKLVRKLIKEDREEIKLFENKVVRNFIDELAEQGIPLQDFQPLRKTDIN
jgi:hypothetical protein